MESVYRYKKYHTPCVSCGNTTTNRYARVHKGLCKLCFDSRGDNQKAIQLETLTPSRNERILESGYMNYAREEDHF